MSRLPGPQGISDPWCNDPGASAPLSFFHAPAPAGLQQPSRALDELTPIAQWMAQEMLRNASGEDAQKISILNRNSNWTYDTCAGEMRDWPLWKKINGRQYICLSGAARTKVPAYIAWAMLVRQDGPWDHKPIIARRFTPAVDPGVPQHFHRYHDRVYFYDVWSNIHYGYVGRACGFSESELLDGAGLEQIPSDMLNRRVPWPNDGWFSGMRTLDHPEDRVSVEMGIELYNLPSECVNASQLVSRIVARRDDLITRPYPQ
ncbi:polymorphic toxin type 44 domain-containing protein [Halopseudomonas salegens]|uniref:Toxin 44 n=1 Tax=Halopseudomonas salegens TaxID=1434072 RepID=A0A1H2GUD7_9GAMM|nr:polymorphic toxin type 44 domain-containing protein [Halopseudomonas salegens]SDU23121.1 toxin 44 [Halopseudomonas salegens]